MWTCAHNEHGKASNTTVTLRAALWSSTPGLCRAVVAVALAAWLGFTSCLIKLWALKANIMRLWLVFGRAKMTIVRYDKMVIYKLTGFYHVCNNMPYNEKNGQVIFFSCLLVFLHRTKQVTNNKERVMQRWVQTQQEWVLYKPNIEHTLYFDLLFRKENRVLVCPHLKYFGKVLLCHVFHSEHHSNYPEMHNTSKRKSRLISVLFCLNTTFPYQMIRCVFEANNGKKKKETLFCNIWLI